MKEEWREQGYSESEINKLAEETQKALENEEEPGDLEAIKKRISDAATGTAPELKGEVSEARTPSEISPQRLSEFRKLAEIRFLRARTTQDKTFPLSLCLAGSTVVDLLKTHLETHFSCDGGLQDERGLLHRQRTGRVF